ncbi:flavin-containing monooxygenase [Gryllotalpicola protaetiae]|uniref:NAD(P)/FAD-dependent oxidoreductase n=1 Tax=Gryllotalpicola protaetiae TaxID=2419771 RepID=A0A387BQN2_9MICO|nr:NAD(P)/FAD-dependent oxidoreductase [Gryllotalpicola protaetiae]AYG03286.1 NAD(P)/FAD-dependent oxidoreductase [Gryllotalpicola protaetiae]
MAERSALGTAVIGAGIAGIGMGAQLKRAGRHDFLIFERADDLGGTWRDNSYPGVACDIPSRLYSYSFRPKQHWSRRFAPGAEILEYLRDTAQAEGLAPHLRLGETLTSARWDDESGCWRLTTPRGEYSARALVMAAGRLSEPKTPGIPGLETFPGRAFHSARWDHAPLDGLRVGIVGTGASAVQLVPEVAKVAASVTVFQRTPAWVLPRGDRALAPGEPQPDRAALSAEAEQLFDSRLSGSPELAALRAKAETHLRAHVADPRLRAELTPDYELGCKRAVFSDDYFTALQRPNVTLEPSALTTVDGTTAVAASGARYELDVLVFATGFETTRPPFARLVTGRDGETLAAHWADGMTSHASTVVHGFPNLFVLDGPNAALGHHSAFEVIEAQLGYVLGALERLDATDAPLEVTADAEAAYSAEIDRLAARTVWVTGGCSSWYRDEASGRLTLLWPARVSEFRDRYGTFDPAPFAQPIPQEVRA